MALPLWSRLLAAPAVVAVTLLGLWFFAGVVTNDFRASMALTAVWFACAGATALWLSWRRPELRLPVGAVYLVPERSERSIDGGVRLGALKGNVGSQQYDVPAELLTSEPATVVVWCRAFTVAFGTAELAPA